jgi:GMP synthase (glutamine-hydrolysing)
MLTLIVLQHLDLEGPGRIGDLARERGWRVDVRELHRGAELPTDLAPDAVLLVMGGPMGVGDVDDPRFPFLAREADLLRRILPAGKPVLGVCLGAQLMAHALGAEVAPLLVGDPPQRHREVGWGAVGFCAGDPVLAGLPAALEVLHWHGDTFALPAGAVRLAETLACPQQMFRYGTRAFGLQFHIEVEAAEIARWVHEDAAFVLAANGKAGGARILADTQRIMPRHRPAGDRLINNLLDALTS